MKENNFNTNMTEADFDARCRTLLEASTAVAPEPRADLFADAAPKGAGMRGAKWGAAAIVMVGVLSWLVMANQDGEPTHPSQGTEREANNEAQDAAVDVAVMEPAAIESKEEAAVNTVQGVTDVDVATSAIPASATTVSAATVREVSIEPQPLSADAEPRGLGSEQAGEASMVTEASAIPLETQTSEEAAAAHGPSEVNTEDVLPPGSSNPAVQELPEEEAVPAETPANGPKLTLPLTLPSGGGQR